MSGSRGLMIINNDRQNLLNLYLTYMIDYVLGTLDSLSHLTLLLYPSYR